MTLDPSRLGRPGPRLDVMTSYRTSPSRSGRWVAAALFVGLTALGAACGSSTSRNAGISGTTAPTAGSSTSAPPATSAPATTAPGTVTTTALSSALTASYQAETGTLATYRNVVAALGAVGPFPNIVTSEEQHVATVSGLLNLYRIPVPAAAAGQASPTTLTAACALGVTLEQRVISMYADQIPKVSAYPNVVVALQNLQAASRDNHLPAFQHCA